jgi:hypothetical protein
MAVCIWNAKLWPGLAGCDCRAPCETRACRAKGPACPNPNIGIQTPASGSRVVRGNILTLSGTAAEPNFVRYQSLTGINGSWGHISDFQQSVTNGDLMELHTNTLPHGTYTFRLQVMTTPATRAQTRPIWW